MRTILGSPLAGEHMISKLVTKDQLLGRGKLLWSGGLGDSQLACVHLSHLARAVESLGERRVSRPLLCDKTSGRKARR